MRGLNRNVILRETPAYNDNDDKKEGKGQNEKR